MNFVKNEIYKSVLAVKNTEFSNHFNFLSMLENFLNYLLDLSILLSNSSEMI